MVKKANVRSEEISAELRNEVEDMERRRKRDAVNKDIEISSIGKRMSNLNDTVSSVANRFERVNEVSGLMLEVMNICTALTAQDTADREQTNLMGFKEVGENEGIHSPRSPKSATSSPRRTAAKAVRQHKVLSVDKRCLSCSGQSTHILQAFKMACLSYSPSPILYMGKENKREELVDRMSTLISQAQSFYESQLDAMAAKDSRGISVFKSFVDTRTDKTKLPDVHKDRPELESARCSMISVTSPRKGSDMRSSRTEEGLVRLTNA